MQIEMTPNGVGSAVHELMANGSNLEDAVTKVIASLRKEDSAFLASDLVGYCVRRAEQDVWQRHRPLALNGAEAGHGTDEPHLARARPARSMFKANPLDFEFFVPGVGRKRFGACTTSDMMKIHHRWHHWGRTLTKKAQQIKKIYEAMNDKGVDSLDELRLDGGSPMLIGLV